MPRSAATTVAEYLRQLPDDRRAIISKVRATIRKSLPKGYSESVGWGMITYGIPLSDYPNTYNGQPLCYAALASQKNYCSLYLMCAYGNSKQGKRLADEFKKRGKKLDMGKSCVRFKTLDDLSLDVIAEVIASTPPKDFIAIFEAARRKKSLPAVS